MELFLLQPGVGGGWGGGAEQNGPGGMGADRHPAMS